MNKITVVEIIDQAGLVLEVVAPGLQGPAPSLAIGTVEAGSAAAADIVSQGNGYALNLTLPVGPQGNPINAQGLWALLADAEGDAAVVLADQLARMISSALPDLQALPLATGARVAAIGDSQIAFNNIQSGSALPEGASSNALGFLAQARGIEPRFRFENWYDPADPTGRNLAGANQGVFADELANSPTGQPVLGGILGRLPAVLARRPDILIIEGGTNTISFGADNSAAYVIARLNLALALARRAGVWSILMTIYPRSAWHSNDPVRQQILTEVNSWIRRQQGRDGVLGVLDADPILAPSGIIDPGLFQSDLVHVSVRGAIRLAQDGLLPLLALAISPGSIFNPDPGVDNFFVPSRANLEGTTGTLSGSGVAGQVASGFSLSLDRNASSITASKATVSGPVQAQLLDIVPADLNGSAYGGCSIVLPPVISPALAAGEWVQGFIHIETDAVEAFSIARLQLAIRQSTTVRARSYGHNVSSGNFSLASPASRAYWLMTEPLRVPDAVTFDRLYSALEVYWDKTKPAFRLTISRPMIRKVADPRQAWGY